jgi:hypothetical protein
LEVGIDIAVVCMIQFFYAQMKLMQGFLMSVVFPRIMMMSVAVKKPELPNGLKCLKKRGTIQLHTARFCVMWEDGVDFYESVSVFKYCLLDGSMDY